MDGMNFHTIFCYLHFNLNSFDDVKVRLVRIDAKNLISIKITIWILIGVDSYMEWLDDLCVLR